jgi:hypothetical protein
MVTIHDGYPNNGRMTQGAIMRKTKTDHSGAKNGGGYWGKRAEAKQISKKLRRASAKKDITIASESALEKDWLITAEDDAGHKLLRTTLSLFPYVST